MSDVTRILAQIESGDPSAASDLLPLVYEELRKLAASRLAQEAPGQTLDATGLVHEAYLRLVPSASTSKEGQHHWDGRAHFFAAAAEAMRRILIDSARRKHRQKHGGDHRQVDLELVEVIDRMPDDALLELDDAITKFALEDPIKARLVQLRFFAGLKNDEAAAALGISAVTAKRYWRFARAWLHREINSSQAGKSS